MIASLVRSQRDFARVVGGGDDLKEAVTQDHNNRRDRTSLKKAVMKTSRKCTWTATSKLCLICGKSFATNFMEILTKFTQEKRVARRLGDK
jgi:hypothetical protein